MTSPHPDDERLSAAFDGDDAEALAHAEACSACRARLADFERVAALVAAPVAVPAADAAVAAALRAATVVPLRRRPSPVALAVAAGLVVVMGAVAVLTGGGDSRDDMTAAGRPEAAGDMAATSGGADLGDLRDPTALAERLRAVVEPPVAGAPVASADGAAEAQAEPQAASRPASGSAARRQSGGSCTPTAADEYGAGLGELVYQAALRWDGTPAVALVYQVAGASGPLDHRVLVMAQEGCRLLVAQSF